MCRPRTARPGITAGQHHALAECRLPPAGAGAAEPPSKSLTTRCSLDQRWRLSPTTEFGFLVRKPQWLPMAERSRVRGNSQAVREHDPVLLMSAVCRVPRVLSKVRSVIETAVERSPA